MRRPSSLLLLLLLSSAPAIAAEIRWYAPGDATPAFRATIPERSAVPAPLLHSPDFPTVSSFAIPLLDGSRLESPSLRGKVVLLDFWASWCEPCLRELPHLESLWKTRHAHGLEAIAVNAEEPDDLALRTAKQLGLTLPIGRYTPEIEERFAARTLPTVVLLDREGRLRGRWDGYEPGLETAIAARVDSLLGEDVEAAPREIARVDPGGTSVRVLWASDLAEPAAGVAFYRTAEGEARAAVAAGSSLSILDGAGRRVRRLRVPPEVHRLETAISASDRAPRLLAWRPGGDKAIEIRPEAERVRAILAPAAVFDLAESMGGGLWWGTPVGIFRSEADGSAPKRVGEPFGVRRLLSSGENLLVLDDEGGLRKLTGEANAVLLAGAPARVVGLVAGAKGAFGAYDAPAVDAVEAALFGPRARGIALAAAPDRVVVYDASGAVRWSATVDGVFDLEAGDLDGDGDDELLVSAGKRVLALAFDAAP
jgi:thiol-disulfide isomerase/thioredoxin